MNKSIAILLFALYMCGVSAQAGDEREEVVATAKELFDLDMEGIKKKFGDGSIAVKGIAADVGPDMFGLPSVTLSDAPDGTHYVLCVLPYTDYMKLGDIKKGSEVTMSGSPRGKTDQGVLVMKQSVLVDK